MDSLRQKIAMFSAKRDDRVIELCKKIIEEQAAIDNPGFIPTHSFYTYVNGSEIIYVYDENENQVGCLLPNELPDVLYEKFQTGLLNIAVENYAVIDQNWASEFLNSNLGMLQNKDFVDKKATSETDDFDDFYNTNDERTQEEKYQEFLNKYKKN